MKEHVPFYNTFLERARWPVRIDKQQFQTEKAKSLPGFEPGLYGQDAIALPIVPTPLPCQNLSVRNIFIGKGSIERSTRSIVRSKSEMDWTILTEMFRKRFGVFGSDETSFGNFLPRTEKNRQQGKLPKREFK